MKRLMLSAAMILSVAGITSPAAAQSGIQQNCDRNCLTGKLDQFLKAVVAKAPAQAGLWVGFRQTQNAEITPAGGGIWQTNTGLGSVDRRYYDPQTSQAEFFGTMREGDKQAVVSLRLKVQYGQVSEAEWHIARAGDPGITGDKNSNSMFNVDNLIKNQPAVRTVPVAQRRPREELVAAVNSYFDGIVAQTGRWVQGNPGCLRLENGQGAPEWAVRGVSKEDADFQTASDCRSGYAGLNIINVQARRYLMVDEEAQVVIASATFIREPLNHKRRNSFMEVFYMDGGKISAVYAAMVYAHPQLPMPNWAPYEGNYPVSPSVINAR